MNLKHTSLIFIIYLLIFVIVASLVIQPITSLFKFDMPIKLDGTQINSIQTLAILLTLLIIFYQFESQGKELKIIEMKTIPRLDIINVEKAKFFLVPDKKAKGNEIWYDSELNKDLIEKIIVSKPEDLFIKRVDHKITLFNPTEMPIYVNYAEPEKIIEYAKKIFNSGADFSPDVTFDDNEKYIVLSPTKPSKDVVIHYIFRTPLPASGVNVVNSKITYNYTKTQTTGICAGEYYVITDIFGEGPEEMKFSNFELFKKIQR